MNNTRPKTDAILIGLCGPAGSGKSTLAEAIVKQDPARIHLRSFALKLKAVLNDLHGWEFDQWEDQEWKEGTHDGVCPRKEAQALGTFYRDQDPDFWIKRIHVKRFGPEEIIVITDVRYENEAAWIRSQGGIIVKRGGFNAGSDGHQSETEQERIEADYEVPWYFDSTFMQAVTKAHATRILDLAEETKAKHLDELRFALEQTVKPVLLIAPDQIWSWKDYVELTKATAINVTAAHVTAGLQEEIGEVWGLIKRKERGDYDGREDDYSVDMKKELGDVCWYLAQASLVTRKNVVWGRSYTSFASDFEAWLAGPGDPASIMDIAERHDLTFSDIWLTNIQKTYDRWNRNQTIGKGDNR